MGQNAEKIIFMARNTHKYVAKEGSRNLICRRAPHGARGLKRDRRDLPRNRDGSRPARGVQRGLVRQLERTKYGLRRATGELYAVKNARPEYLARLLFQFQIAINKIIGGDRL